MENLFGTNNRRHDEEWAETVSFMALTVSSATTNTSNCSASTSSSSQDSSTYVAPREPLDDTFLRHAEDVPDNHSLETLQVGNTVTKQDESSWKRKDLDRLREENLRLKRQKADSTDQIRRYIVSIALRLLNLPVGVEDPWAVADSSNSSPHEETTSSRTAATTTHDHIPSHVPTTAHNLLHYALHANNTLSCFCTNSNSLQFTNNPSRHIQPHNLIFVSIYLESRRESNYVPVHTSCLDDVPNLNKMHILRGTVHIQCHNGPEWSNKMHMYIHIIAVDTCQSQHCNTRPLY